MPNFHILHKRLRERPREEKKQKKEEETLRGEERGLNILSNSQTTLDFNPMWKVVTYFMLQFDSSYLFS